MLPEDTISVIMGIKYCRPELDTLRRSLDSILAQTYAEFELLICERGSSHLAKELLADYASRDPRVRVIDGSGAGSFSEQLNICLGQSRGAWIARMDDDDYSEPERFEKQLAYLRTHGGTAFVGCNVRLIQDGGDVGAQCFPENPQVRDFLRGEGYDLPQQPDDDAPLLRQLSRRLCCEADFPHEIGVFLGYPLPDVVGFIENEGRNFTCCGCWKAYGDPAAARQHFAQLNKCTAVYLRLFHSGTPIQRLAVAA